MAEMDGGRQAAANFSRNIKARREAIGMSQERLAEVMTARGFGFTQATVWKVESGQRGISLTEGLAIVDILGGDTATIALASLVQAPEVDQARQALEGAAAGLTQTSAAIETAVAAYLQATQNYAMAFAVATDRTPEEKRTGAIWDWEDPQAPELIALQARLQQPDRGGAAPALGTDAVLDAVAAFEGSLRENGWPWAPWRPDDFIKTEPGNAEPAPAQQL